MISSSYITHYKPSQNGGFGVSVDSGGENNSAASPHAPLFVVP